jgi:hypothetical protein
MAAVGSLRERLEREHGVRVTIEDDCDHPIDLNPSKFADAGYLAAALVAAWLRSPNATNEELASAAWDEAAGRSTFQGVE